MKFSKLLLQKIYLWTTVLVFLSTLFFFNFNYRYIDDYKLFMHNSSIDGFLDNYKWGFSRIVGNYFFGLLFYPQSNVFLNVSVLTIHIVNGLILFALLRKKLSTLTSVILGMLFISLPITSEAFFWGIAGQVVFAVFFFLLSVYIYQKHHAALYLRHKFIILSLFTLSISFYEVFILFPFVFFCVTLLRKKDRVLSLALSSVSAAYLFILKYLTVLLGGNLTAQQKTNTIAVSDVPERVFRIISDLIQVFFGKVSLDMYVNSLRDVIQGSVSLEFSITLLVFTLTALLLIWIFSSELTKNNEVASNEPQLLLVSLSFMLAASLILLLTIPVNYFHDLRTYYPFTVALTLLIGEYIRLFENRNMILRIHLTLVIILITINTAVLKVENNQYVAIYNLDWPVKQALEENARHGINTIIYLPGYNSNKPLALQMNYAYYPEANFLYGTHMLHAFSILFTRDSFAIHGSKQSISTFVQTQPSYRLIYDFVNRKMVTTEEFLSSEQSWPVDLTMLDSDKYYFKDTDLNIQNYDSAVIHDRKLLKAFVTHPNCGESPATLYVTTPPLANTCKTSFRLLNVQDVERRTISDGVEFKFYVNDDLKEMIHLKPNDPAQTENLYTYSVEPSATGSATLRFEVTDGGQRNCNDDKIFIAEPILSCE